MSNSLLSSFNPLATHPFTNNNGLLPSPALPSQYPHHQHQQQHQHPHLNQHQHRPTPAPLHTPQPKRAHPHAQAHPREPIFVPFRPERSSPELEDILLKKKLTDAFHGKAQWHIDQVSLAPSSASAFSPSSSSSSSTSSSTSSSPPRQ